MIDALGHPQSVLLLGGTSDIGVAIVERWLGRPPLRVVLAARPSPRRDDTVRRLENGGAAIEAHDFDARDTTSHSAVVDAAFAGGDIDVVVVAFGVLGDPERAWQDHAAAVELAQVNVVAPVSCGVVVAAAMRRQGHGCIVALSSVAGERVRRSNFVYGATKAGMDGFYLGLGEALRDDGIHVLVVRPGFVRTKMTVGTRVPPLSTTPERVAEAVAEAVATREALIWVPGSLRHVMSALRHVPRPLFRRLPL